LKYAEIASGEHAGGLAVKDDELNLTRLPAALLERFLKFLRGDDIFVSYSRADGAAYATGLAAQLAKRNFSCRFDQWGTEPGAEMPRQLMVALRRSAMLVLVGTERAARSTNVAEEIKEFKKNGRRIIPVVFDGVRLANGIFVQDGKLQQAAAAATSNAAENPEALWAQDIQGLPIFCEGAQPFKSGAPSEAALDRIEKTVTFWRRDQRLRTAAWIVSVILVILIATSLVAALIAGRYADAALRASKEADRQLGISVGRQAQGDADALRRQSLQRSSGWPEALQHGALLSIEASRRMTQNGLPPGEADLALRAILDRLPRLLRHIVLDASIDKAILMRDGTYVITSSGGISQVRNSVDGKPVAVLGEDVEFSADRVLAAPLRRDGKLAVLELPHGRTLWEKQDGGKIGLRRFSRDGSYFAAEVASTAKNARSKVIVRNARTGAQAATIGYAGSLIGMALSRTGERLALSLNQTSGQRRKSLSKNVVQIWNLEGQSPKLLIQAEIPAKRGADGQRRAGYQPLTDLAFSPDSKFLAASTEYHATILDVATLKQLAAIGGPDRDPDDARGNNVESIIWLDFSKDGKTLGTAGDDGTVHAWAVPGGGRVHSEMIPGKPPNGGCAVVDDKGGARIVDISTGKDIARVLTDKVPRSCDYAPESQRLVLYEGRDIWLFDTGGSQEDARISNDGSADMRMRNLSSDGRYLAMADGKKALLWDVVAIRELASVEHSGTVYWDVPLTRDATRFATVTWDGKLYLWEVGNPQPVWTINSLPVVRKDEDDEDQGEQWNVKAVYFSPGSKFLVLELENEVGGVGTYVWDVTTHRESMRVPRSEAHSLRFTMDDKTALIERENDLTTIDMMTGKPPVDSATGKPGVGLPIERYGLRFDFEPNAGLVARDVNGAIAVSSLDDSRRNYLLSDIGDNPAFAFSPSGKKLVALGRGDKRTGRVVDAVTGRTILPLTTSKSVDEFEFSATERHLATIAHASGDEFAEIIIWDIEKGRKWQLPSLERTIGTVVFSPDEHRVAVVGSRTAKAWVFRLDSRVKEAELTIDRQTNDARFSPDRKRISGVEESRNPEARFSSDSRMLLHWAKETLSVWEMGSWTEAARLVHGRSILSASLLPGGRVATVSQDLIARQWVLPANELIGRVCRELTSNLSMEEWRRNFGSEPYAKTCVNLTAPESSTKKSDVEATIRGGHFRR
jgi:WD40 repeat protein